MDTVNPQHGTDLGPLEPILADPDVMEILVNGPDHIYVERRGRLERVESRFRDEAHLMEIIQHIVGMVGQRADESNPIVDARLADASRVHVVVPPIALTGPSLTIRKLFNRPISIENLIEWESISADMVEFLRACVQARVNIVVSGGTGSGKTTLMNILCGFIPADERLVVLQQDAELRLPHEHQVVLETRPPNLEGRGEVTMRQLVQSAVKMRPDRIIVGELRGGEALDVLQAMNTGHDGSMVTLHASSPRDALARLEMMALMGGMDIPVRTLREQMASAINLIVQIERLQDGARRVVKVAEVMGAHGDIIATQDIFEFVVTGLKEDGKLAGEFVSSGHVPTFIHRIQAAGVQLPAAMFAPSRDFTHPLPPLPPLPPIPPLPPVPPRPRR